MKDNHTPGEWMWGEFDSQLFISSNKLIGDIVGKDTTRDTTKSFKEHRDNFALMTAACNSYHKNCGDRAVECAEGDLLGQFIEALKQVMRTEGDEGWMQFSADSILADGFRRLISQTTEKK